MGKPYPTQARLSNRLADLAERAGEAFRAGRARSIEAATAYLDCGRLLAEAKAECAHGEWLPFLARADIPGHTARRMMRLHRSGMDAETLATQGVRAALASMARPAKLDTVSNLPPPAAPAKPDTAPGQARAPTLYQRRKAAFLCVVCGTATGGPVRCPAHARIEADRRKARRALAGMGEKLAPRIAAAASAGQGVRLSAAEAAELAGMIGRNDKE